MFRLASITNAFGLSEAGMAVSDYVPIFFTNRLHLAGRPQMTERSSDLSKAFSSTETWDAPPKAVAT